MGFVQKPYTADDLLAALRALGIYTTKENEP